MTDNKNIIGMLENIHLLRKLFVRRVCEKSPLHFGQAAIMKMIEENDNCTQSVIAERLSVTPASVAVSTKRLQKAGLITKTVDEDNLRCKRLSLTPEGKKAIDEHISFFRDYDEIVFRDFTDEEKEQLFGYLSRIASVMRGLEGVEENYQSVMELSCALRKRMEEQDNCIKQKGDK